MAIALEVLAAAAIVFGVMRTACRVPGRHRAARHTGRRAEPAAAAPGRGLGVVLIFERAGLPWEPDLDQADRDALASLLIGACA